MLLVCSEMLRKLRAWLEAKVFRFAEFTADVIYERRTGRRAAVYGAVLLLPSYLYSIAVQIRLWLYRKRIFHDRPLGCLVVVVGNLTLGGTGKTPIVEKFARSLAERGRKVAILSRGYKSKPEPLWRRVWLSISHGKPLPPKIVSDGHDVLLDSETAGDEPYMLARNLPGVVVVVDKNRVKGGFHAILKYGCDTLILDDGFQYLALKGRLNLLLIDKTNPFGNRHLLPRGILREPVRHLKRASYIFLTKSNGKPTPELIADIRRYSDAEIIECAHRPKYLKRVWGDDCQPLTQLQGSRVGAFSAIATPENFEQFLRDFGASLLYTKRFLDHHRFSDDELDQIFSQAMEAGLDFVVTTEKDAVRLPNDIKTPLPLYYLRLEVEIISGVNDFEEAVSRICFPGLPRGQGK